MALAIGACASEIQLCGGGSKQADKFGETITNGAERQSETPRNPIRRWWSFQSIQGRSAVPRCAPPLCIPG